jgi:hypothetical protein
MNSVTLPGGLQKGNFSQMIENLTLTISLLEIYVVIFAPIPYPSSTPETNRNNDTKLRIRQISTKKYECMIVRQAKLQ